MFIAIAVDFFVYNSSLVNFFVFGFEVAGFVGFSDKYVAMVTIDVRVLLAHWECKLMNKKSLIGNG